MIRYPFVAKTLNVKVKDVLTMVTRLYSKEPAIDLQHEDASIESQSYAVLGDTSYTPEQGLSENCDQLTLIKNAIKTLDDQVHTLLNQDGYLIKKLHCLNYQRH